MFAGTSPLLGLLCYIVSIPFINSYPVCRSRSSHVVQQSPQHQQKEPSSSSQEEMMVSRPSFLRTTLASSLLVMKHPSPVHGVAEPKRSSQRTGFQYSDKWTGTTLDLLTLEEASMLSEWSFAHWPDPILRRPAATVPIDEHSLKQNLTLLSQTSRLLEETARREGAVGLAAQQCGVNARMIYVQRFGTLVNPIIVQRSPEPQMKVWKEECLVLPPTFRATVLRDDWIDVQYLTTEWERKTQRFSGELSRCLQHEMDHDRGILIVDHVAMDELENDIMKEIERPGHEARMSIAYDRYLSDPVA